MKRFNFTAAQVDRHAVSAVSWYEFVRASEVRHVLEHVPGSLGRTLEVGAGNGFQSQYLAERCRSLVCTELNPESHANLGRSFLARERPGVSYVCCDCRDLSRYAGGEFDTIYSSNVLEHVSPLPDALREFHRVLADGGRMLHLLPTRAWKVGYFLGSLLKRERPQVHGEFAGHGAEWLGYGPENWAAAFSTHGFELAEIVGMPFYLGHANAFRPLLKAGNALRLSGSYLYVLRKRAGPGR